VADQRAHAASTRRRLRAFRAFAWVTGLGLVALCVAMVFAYAYLVVPSVPQDRRGVAVIGPVHGFLYMGYIVATLLLAERMRWAPAKAVLILLAGTVPFASFVAERRVTREVQARCGAAR